MTHAGEDHRHVRFVGDGERGNRKTSFCFNRTSSIPIV
jgi:hypothetical protein